jgi:hypothetical protein
VYSLTRRSQRRFLRFYWAGCTVVQKMQPPLWLTHSDGGSPLKTAMGRPAKKERTMRYSLRKFVDAAWGVLTCMAIIGTPPAGGLVDSFTQLAAR